nr:Rpn family recombination-promoting nuclease/putative transposase [Turicibacter sp.]
MTVALLPPKMDFVFKRIFGNENHPNILISFLNAVLNPGDPIKSVILKDTTIEKSHLEDKYSRLDVKAMTNKGEHINIEIQLKDEYNMIKR